MYIKISPLPVRISWSNLPVQIAMASETRTHSRQTQQKR